MRLLLSLPSIFLFSISLFAQGIQLEMQEEGVLFKENNRAVLFYQAAPKSHEGTFTRANYIHPLYAPDGSELTEDFPADHLHHRGIFWAWHQIYIGDKRIGDSWETKDFSWEVKKMKAKGDGILQTIVEWKSPLWKKKGIEKAFVREKTYIRVQPSKSNYYIVDIEINLKSLQKNMKIGGSEDPKGYGGFSPRIKLSTDIAFTGKDGEVIPQTNPVIGGPWLDISGSIGKNGSQAGVSILCHPDNPGFPQPWILRAKGSMQNAVYPYPGAQAVPLNNLRLKYRLIVHQGRAKDINIEQLFQEYITE